MSPKKATAEGTKKRTRKPRQAPRAKLEERLEKIGSQLGTYLVPKYATAGEPFAAAIREAQTQVHAATMLVRGFADDWALARKNGRTPLAVGDWVEPRDGVLPFLGAEPRRVLAIDGAYVQVDGGEKGACSFAAKLVKKIVRPEVEA